ncbi:MAG: hypothetical protein ACJ77K_03980 [Bacteroidia bacterium]
MKSKRIIDSLVFCTISFFGIKGIIETWRNDSYGMFPDLWEVFMFIAGLCSFVYVLFYIVKPKFERGKLSNSALLILFYGATIIVLMFVNSNCKPEELLFGGYDGDFNGTSISLRKDGTYEVENSCLGGGDYYRGSFRIKGDTILLDHKVYFYNDFYLSEKLLIQNKQIYQMDALGHKLEKEMTFQITKTLGNDDNNLSIIQ